MSGLLGPNGLPISSATYDAQNKKEKAPALGEAFGNWAGRDKEYVNLPGGGVVQFDLSKLTLDDFRAMKDHYQVNASLAVLSFMQHQSDWHLEGDDQRIVDHCEENLRSIWTPLNRSLAQANWAGFSPSVLDWENQERKIVINKVKDLIPDECEVKWDLVEGWAPPGRTPPKYKVYGGIKHRKSPWPIPVENTLWYPLLMENGDYSGKRLLRPAFQSWFFSILVHLFANRYYERFGEPTPIGRAPFDEDIDLGGNTDTEAKRGSVWMLETLQALRNRSVVVLPNDRTQDTATGKPSFDYDIEYLESQMRGADFERYMSRLDEEISLALFTPVLLMRTSDVGSYNLGVGHMQVYLWMLNAMNDDRAVYINKYLLRKMTDYNFSKKAPAPRIVFRKLGQQNAEMLKDIVMQLLGKGQAKVDIREIGQMTGMNLTEIKQTVDPDPDGDEEGGDPGPDAPPGGGQDGSGGNSAVRREIWTRVRPQVENAYRDGKFGPDLKINMGFKRKFMRELEEKNLTEPALRAERFYAFMDDWTADVVTLGTEAFPNAESFLRVFRTVMDAQIREACA